MAYAPHRNGNVAPDWVMGRQLTPYGLARDPAGRVYVTNYWLDSVSVFAPGAAGSASPVATIRGSKTGIESPTGIAVDSKGKIYVVNGAGDSANYPTADAKVRIDVYSACSDGNVAPIAVIQGSRTRLQDPMAVAVDSSDKIYVADTAGADDPDSPARVIIYAAGNNGNVRPIATISGDKTGLDMANGIAVDSGGKIYVTNDGSFVRHLDTVTVYPPGAHGNVAPVATFGGIGGPQGIAVDSAGTNRNVAPLLTITGPTKQFINTPDGIALDSNKNIYLSIMQGGSLNNGVVDVFAAGSNGKAMPGSIISFATASRMPQSVAVDSGRNLYVELRAGPGGKSSIWIYPPDSHGAASPIATINGVPAGSIALDSVGRIYATNGEVADSERGSAVVYPGLLSQGSKPGEPAQISLSSLPGYPNVKPIARFPAPTPGSIIRRRLRSTRLAGSTC
jgi:hypothetical protein